MGEHDVNVGKVSRQTVHQVRHAIQDGAVWEIVQQSPLGLRRRRY
jgi:hypothetical protein